MGTMTVVFVKEHVRAEGVQGDPAQDLCPHDLQPHVREEVRHILKILFSRRIRDI